MIRLLTLILLSLTLFIPTGCGDTSGEAFERGLITSTTPLPEGAEDRRDDGILRDPSGRPVSHPLLGKRFPAFGAPNINGTQFSTDDLIGQWTVITIWGVWCHDSRNDAENISAVASHFSNHPDIGYVSLHVPPGADDLDRRFRNYGSVNGYFADRGLSWPTVLDETATIREILDVQWTPTYLLVGPDLTIQAFRTDLSVVTDHDPVSRFIENVEEIMTISAQ